MKSPRLVALVALFAVVALVPVAHGQLLLSTNDNKVTLVNGATTVVKSPPPDTLTVIDLKAWPPKVLAELDVPGSVVGPPFSVAVSPDESLALVEKELQVFSLDGGTLKDTGVRIAVKGGPAAIRIADK